MTNTLPIHELVQELRRADINISANVSENLHGILDFSYESPMEFNGHASLVTYEQFLNGIYTNNVGHGERGNRTLGDFVFYRCHEFLVLLSKPYKHRA